jgi:hypothetical protein
VERERDRLRQENEKLKKQLEEAQRAAKRQAAPFSRGTRNTHPKPPGRKPGTAYGKHRRKPIPKKVDEVIAVPAPTHCKCGGELEVEKIESECYAQHSDSNVKLSIMWSWHAGVLQITLFLILNSTFFVALRRPIGPSSAARGFPSVIA